MALAFRAAAGEIPFEDSNGKPFVENSWEKIDADEPFESSERCERLKEQIVLIEKEIARVNDATERRLALTEEAEKHRDAARIVGRAAVRGAHCLAGPAGRHRRRGRDLGADPVSVERDRRATAGRAALGSRDAQSDRVGLVA